MRITNNSSHGPATYTKFFLEHLAEVLNDPLSRQH